MRDRDLLNTGSAAFATRRVLIIAVTLCLTGVGLWAGPWGFDSPAPPMIPAAARATNTRPVRTPALKAEIQVAGFTYNCSDCHKLFASPPQTTRSLTQHRHVVLKHGLNDRCFNCHHLTNRDAYADDWGNEIPAGRPELLCGKCHGPVYRDWLSGAHGRTNSYWDESKGPRDRRTCTECHDPHAPPFAPIPPAPGPNTPRMGDPHFEHHQQDVPNPLQVFRGSLQDQRSVPSPQVPVDFREGS